MELEVRRVGVQSCFVALPPSLLEILLGGTLLPSFPVVIELSPVEKSGPSGSFLVAWDGAASSSSHIEVSEALAECIGLLSAARVRVRARVDVAAAEIVVVEPASEDDWEVLELNAEYLENHILSKVGVLSEGQQFPVWVAGKVVLKLRVISTSPARTVKLVPGAELVVAPKKREVRNVSTGGHDMSDMSSSEQNITTPVREAWLRVQETDSSLTQMLELPGLKCSTIPSTTVFISPITARAISFEDGELLFVSSGLGGIQKQRVTSNRKVQDTGASNHEQRGDNEGLEDEDEFGHKEGSPYRDAIVRLRLREDVAAGHVMVAFPLRVYLGATVHMSIQLRVVSQKNFAQLDTLVLSPVLFKFVEEMDSTDGDIIDDLDTAELLRLSKPDQDEGFNRENPQKKWQGHKYVLSSANQFQKEKVVRNRVHETDLRCLLSSWWDAQVSFSGLLPEQAVKGVPISSEAIMHIRIGSSSDQEILKERHLSHKFASPSMPDVFLPMGEKSIGKARNVLFHLRAECATKDSSQDERQKSLDIKQLPLMRDPFAKYFLLKKEMICLNSECSVEQHGKGKRVHLTLEQGLPGHLSCSKGMISEVIEGPALKSLTWLEGPATEALARLQVLLFPVLRNKLKLLHTPLPGSVLLYGPRACGKTQLALALARELHDNERALAHRVLVQCSELVGKQAIVIRQLLLDSVREAMQQAPSLIILDDLDVLLPAAESEGPEPGVAVLSIAKFLSDLIDICQGRRNNEYPQAAVAFVGVARTPTSIPGCLCLSGRLDFHVQLAAPAAMERAAILSRCVTSRSLMCSTSVAVEAAANCDGADALDLELLVDRAVHAAASRFLSLSSNELHSQALTTWKDNGRKNSYDHALPVMKKEKFELLDQDFLVALKDFVPLAMRGITKAKTKSSSGWEDVGGLYDTRAILREVLEMPVKYSKIFAQAPLRLRTGVLLYGPPGCGKTHIVGAAAAACSLRLISVKGPELLNKYIGASEQGVRDVFSRATAAAPCILFFDEFDAIAPQRGHDNTGVTDRVVNQLLTELDGVEALTGVFVFAATSRPDLLDAALLRPGRLDRLLLCDFPSQRERLDILQVLARKLPLADDVDLDEVANLTEDFSAADLLAVLSDAQLESVHAFLEISQQRVQSDKPIITMPQLRDTVKKARPSVPDVERKRLYGIYDAFMGLKQSKKRDFKGKKATLA